MENINSIPTESILENGKVKKLYNTPTDKIDVVKYKMSKIEIYEIDAKELYIFSTGGIGNNFQTAGWSFISFFIAIILALFTCDIKLPNGFLIFSILATAFFVSSLFCFFFWKRTKTDVETTIKEIKDRAQNL